MRRRISVPTATPNSSAKSSAKRIVRSALRPMRGSIGGWRGASEVVDPAVRRPARKEVVEEDRQAVAESAAGARVSRRPAPRPGGAGRGVSSLGGAARCEAWLPRAGPPQGWARRLARPPSSPFPTLRVRSLRPPGACGRPARERFETDRYRSPGPALTSRPSWKCAGWPTNAVFQHPVGRRRDSRRPPELPPSSATSPRRTDRARGPDARPRAASPGAASRGRVLRRGPWRRGRRDAPVPRRSAPGRPGPRSGSTRR